MRSLILICSVMMFLTLFANAQTNKNGTLPKVKQFGLLMDSVGTYLIITQDSMEFYMVGLDAPQLDPETRKAIDEEVARTNEAEHRHAGVYVSNREYKQIAYRAYNSKKWLTLKK